ncbi:MAG: LysM peptidoglycan-binding domain-containing protein [Actinobacteria bacterium]|nr:LysM peptidoglycan-binding domain-containing protein [Actinomycetota bacterium]
MRAMTRVFSGVAAVAVLVAVLVGAPWAMTAWGRLSLLWSIDWAHAFTVPDDGRLLLGMLSLAGWVAWALVAVSVVVELAEQADAIRALRAQRPHRPVRLPGLDLPRLLVRGLVISATTAGLGVGLSRYAAAAVVAPVTASAVMDRPAEAAPPVSAASGRAARVVAPTTGSTLPDVASGDGASEVVVVRGDSLWKLAALRLGDGARWPEIFALNRDRIEDPNLIHPGWRLRVPGSTLRSPGAVAAATTPGLVPPAMPVAVPAMLPQCQPMEPSRPPTGSAPTSDVVALADGATAGKASDSHPAASPEAGGVPPTAPTVRAGEPDDDARSLTASQALALGVLGTIGAGLAAGLVRTVRRRRDVQLALRPPGRRILFPQAPTRSVESALGVASLSPLAMRLDAAHREREAPGEDQPLPSEDASAPLFMPGAGRATQPSEESPVATASVQQPRHAATEVALAVVTAGLAMGGPVDIDLEAHRLVTIELDDEEAAWGTACAWALELACGPSRDTSGPGGGARIVATGGIGEALAAAELETIVFLPTAGAAVDDLVQTVTRQRDELLASGWTLEDARLDPDARDAWWPTVYVLGAVDDTSRLRVEEVLGGEPRTAVSAILVQAASGHAVAPRLGAHLTGSAEHALLEPAGVRLRPVSLSALGTAGVVDLLRTSGSGETEPAPWYAWEDSPDNVLPLLPRHAVPMKEAVDVGDDSPGVTDFCHPTLMLLGPIQLRGAAGPPPARAERSCIEYCAWMVEHPGATASHMASALLVAEGTRRSNVSRLRGWLGTGRDGTTYLPEAYTGRLYLDPLVSSDWQRLQALVSPGINRVPVTTLVSALKLVRGAPLADAAPGQWHWAEELRTDMVSMIRDIGVQVGETALNQGDLDLARWAAARALVAAPGDELLMTLRLRTEHRAGNRPEVERIVLQLIRHARVLGIDLDDETVRAIQEAIEGRPRARA